MSRLKIRLDRLDGGAGQDFEAMSDGQLLRLVARGMADPEAFLALTESEQAREMELLINEQTRGTVQ